MDNLDNLLSKRAAPQASSALANRIIAATQAPPKKAPGWQEMLADWLGGFEVFKPAYALGFTAAVILAAGLYTSFSPSSPGGEDAMEEIGLYMVYDALSDGADFS